MGFVRVLCAVAASVLVISAAMARAPIGAADPAAAGLGPHQVEPAHQATDVAIAAPLHGDVASIADQEISELALPVAAVQELPEEMVEAPPLQRPDPTLFAVIDLTSQRMTVSDENGEIDSWKISTARSGYETPVGTYTVNWTSRMHYSRQYHYSPMPYSVFFHRGVAVHGTNALRQLGRPASHGCVRAHPKNAKKFYNLVHKHGLKLTKIEVRGTPPPSPVVRKRKPRRYQAQRRRYSYQPFFFGTQPPAYQPRRRRGQRYGGSYGTW